MEPTIESDIYADKPFALGPMVATMNYLSIDQPKAEEENVMVDEHVEVHGESSPSLLVARCQYSVPCDLRSLS